MASTTAACKRCRGEQLETAYRLERTHVVKCQACGMHFLPDLDDLSVADTSELTDATRDYLANELQSNLERFPAKVDMIDDAVEIPGARCMDIGAGGGLFLHLMQQRGADVDGIEPVRSRRQFAAEHYGIQLRDASIEDGLRSDDIGSFQVVTAWDVIEHVNDPFGLIQTMSDLVAPGGVVAFDTPTRDGLLYRLGHVEYAVTGGRSARLIGAMYSPDPFGHKQILSRSEIRGAWRDRGLVEVACDLVTELSFPTLYYLRRIVRNGKAARRLDAIVRQAIPWIPLKNKVVGVFRKPLR